MQTQAVPATLVFNVVQNRQREPVRTVKLRLNKQLLKVAVYKLSPRMLSLVPRVDNHAAMYLGAYPERDGFVKLYGKSLSFDVLRNIIEAMPYVATLSAQRGRTTDTLEPIWRLATCLAFDSLDDWERVQLRIARQYRDHLPVADRQRSRLYQWETDFLHPLLRQDSGHKRVGSAKLKRIAQTIVEHHRLPPDRIFVTNTPAANQNRLGVCRTFRDDITNPHPTFVIVNVHDSTIDTLIHEASHMIINFRHGRADQLQAHGGEFCRMYANLLSTYTSFELDEVINSMRDAKLRVAPASETPGLVSKNP